MSRIPGLMFRQGPGMSPVGARQVPEARSDPGGRPGGGRYRNGAGLPGRHPLMCGIARRRRGDRACGHSPCCPVSPSGSG